MSAIKSSVLPVPCQYCFLNTLPDFSRIWQWGRSCRQNSCPASCVTKTGQTENNSCTVEGRNWPAGSWLEESGVSIPTARSGCLVAISLSSALSPPSASVCILPSSTSRSKEWRADAWWNASPMPPAENKSPAGSANGWHHARGVSAGKLGVGHLPTRSCHDHGVREHSSNAHVLWAKSIHILAWVHPNLW